MQYFYLQISMRRYPTHCFKVYLTVLFVCWFFAVFVQDSLLLCLILLFDIS